jgi:glycosyltransferase involved in cell wall biosynthesis
VSMNTPICTGDPAVSVIVPVRNDAAGLDRLLAALAGQTLRSPYEVIVIDDASTDLTLERVAARPHVLYRRLAQRSGSYAARNAGVEMASAEILAFTDADCMPSPTWLERGLAALDPTIDLVAGRVAVELPSRPTAAALVDAIRFLDQEAYAQGGYGATANLFVRRSVFERVGGFNSRLRSGGDREFGLRATDAGSTIRYAQDALVMHESRSTMRALAVKSMRIGRGMASHRRHAQGRLRDLSPSPWDRYLYMPHRYGLGWHRLEKPLALHRKTMVWCVNYVAAQLPVAAGVAVGRVLDD